MKQYEEHDKLVSVIVPLCGTVKYLKESLDSLADSTYTNFEVWLVDDLVNKFDSKKAKSMAKDYKDMIVRYTKNDQPIGMFPSINKGIEKSNGEYITILMPTDMFDKTYIEKGALLLKGFFGGVIHPFIWNIGFVDDNRGANISYSFHQQKGLIKQRNYLAYCSMFRKDLWEKVGGFNNNSMADRDFWSALEDRGVKFWLLCEPLLKRRVAKR